MNPKFNSGKLFALRRRSFRNDFAENEILKGKVFFLHKLLAVDEELSTKKKRLKQRLKL